MKLRIVVDIDPPTAERCRVEHEPHFRTSCSHYLPSGPRDRGEAGCCNVFKGFIQDGVSRLPECIAAEQQHRAMESTRLDPPAEPTGGTDR